MIARGELEKEIHLIFEQQRLMGNRFATTENEAAYVKIWAAQRPVATKEDILNKIGDCTFEKGEKRAPKASYAFQYFRALDKLNRLRILTPHQPSRKLTDQERNLMIPALFNHESQKYSDLRKLLNLNDEQRFNEIFYDPSIPLKNNEKRIFLSLSEQYKIRKSDKGSPRKRSTSSLSACRL
nr:hypothetical protein [Sporolactobacillus inulinus]